ncbi:MAG: ATP-dependent helicase [Pseudomonadota bacterium]
MKTKATISLEQLWSDAEFKPNNEQKEAILYTGGPLYLPAGPGSGKTRVLLWRTLNLIVFHGVGPEEIFLSTFTEKAAFQLREGLRALLGAITLKTNVHFDISNMYVGTVHSLCRRIVTDRRFSPERKRRRAPLLMDEIDQYLYLYKRVRWDNLTGCVELGDDPNECINKYFTGKGSKSKHNAVTNCITLFNRLSEEYINPEIAMRATRDPDLKNLLSLYKEYLKSLEEPPPAGTADLSLIQQKAVDVLRNYPDAGNIFKHVIIDEYQDTNPIQEELFFELARGYKNICVVGDDDQGLYRFRGATVENFVQFPERWKRELGIKPHEIGLVKNYRSRRKIVSFYNDFIINWDWTKRGDGKGKSVFRIEKEIEATSKDEGPSVIVSTPGNRESVCTEIAGLVRKLLDAGTVTDPNQIAFLFPSLKSVTVQSMKQALEDQGIKVYAPRAGRFLEVPEAEAMFGIFVQILGRPSRGAFPGTDYNDFHDWLERVDS